MALDKGTYRARAVKWVIGEASTKTPQIGIEFRVEHDDGSFDSITSYRYFTDGALEYTVADLRALGWQGVDLLELADNGGGLDTNEVELVLDWEAHNGKTRLKVKYINAGGGVAMKNAMNGDAVKAFAASMRGKIAAISPPKPGGAPAPRSNGKPAPF